MTLFKNKYTGFKIYYCNYCNAIYFDSNEFEDFLYEALDRSKGFSFIRFLKRFFHIGRKNNVKKQTV